MGLGIVAVCRWSGVNVYADGVPMGDGDQMTGWNTNYFCITDIAVAFFRDTLFP